MLVNKQIRLLGQWEEIDGYPGKSVPVGGIAYYITPPATLSNVFTDPFHSVFYLTFILMSCAIFSKAWMEVSGSASAVSTTCGGWCLLVVVVCSGNGGGGG